MVNHVRRNGAVRFEELRRRPYVEHARDILAARVGELVIPALVTFRVVGVT